MCQMDKKIPVVLNTLYSFTLLVAPYSCHRYSPVWVGVDNCISVDSQMGTCVATL